jgi:hypothetical protein
MSDHSNQQDSNAAIARVLQAERDARAAIGEAAAEVLHIAERARADARARADRTERRIRLYAAAFARELAARLAAIEAEGAALTAPDAPRADDEQRLQQAVQQVAQDLLEPHE